MSVPTTSPAPFPPTQAQVDTQYISVVRQLANIYVRQLFNDVSVASDAADALLLGKQVAAYQQMQPLIQIATRRRAPRW